MSELVCGVRWPKSAGYANTITSTLGGRSGVIIRLRELNCTGYLSSVRGWHHRSRHSKLPIVYGNDALRTCDYPRATHVLSSLSRAIKMPSLYWRWFHFHRSQIVMKTFSLNFYRVIVTRYPTVFLRLNLLIEWTFLVWCESMAKNGNFKLTKNS